jgi:hypothetical protein
MEISEECVQEFITLYERAFRVRLPDDEARPLVARLVYLYRILGRKMPPTQPVEIVHPVIR